MNSPFPGMDPYLEAQGRWRDLHASLITYSRDALNEVLSENYVAQIDEQIRLVSPDAVVGVLYPDVLVGLDLLLGGRRLRYEKANAPRGLLRFGGPGRASPGLRRVSAVGSASHCRQFRFRSEPRTPTCGCTLPRL